MLVELRGSEGEDYPAAAGSAARFDPTMADGL
jgi:hypothetical protein